MRLKPAISSGYEKSYLFKILFYSMSSERTVSLKGIFDCYFRIFLMVKVGFTPEGITIQQRNERILANTFIPVKSFNEYNCEESLVVALPKDLKKFLVMLSTRKIVTNMKNEKMRNILFAWKSSRICQYFYKVYRYFFHDCR